ncbi:four-carbon acid sugar kinase family protein [Aeromonas hydrophila]|uniref:four-carbon acid sugar kinase family protein n=1 Tax=Aeromonas hydrophila TaxID=644 RepID=UPI0035B72D5B
MIAILADDLTSALDGAAPFAHRGLSARVMLQIPSDLQQGTDVIAFDLNSRFLPPEEASRRFECAAAGVKHVDIIYKTVDSTLRGNLGHETRGTLIGCGRKQAIVVPAFPDAGRTTVKGRQYVHGVLLEQSEFSQDPTHPITTSLVATRMVGLDTTQYRVCDANNNADIDRVIRCEGLSAPVVWVGSPGIASALARAVSPSSVVCPSYRLCAAVSRVLVVVGSLHPVNQAQLDRVLLSDSLVITLTDNVAADVIAHQVCTAFLHHSIVCLVSARERTNISELANSPADTLGAIVARCTTSFDGLVVTGGDTARRVVDAMNVHSLDLLGEIAPGVPFGLLNVADRKIPFSTKAGGFGDTETLFQCVQILRTTHIKKDDH